MNKKSAFAPGRVARWHLAAALACLAGMALAGNDPTAPPPGLVAAADAMARAPGHAASGAHAASAPAALAPRLESIRSGGDRPATALVDGHMLRVGDRLGDAVVSAIDDQGVSLRSGKGAISLLALAPGIRKTPSGESAADGATRAPLALATRHKDSQ